MIRRAATIGLALWASTTAATFEQCGRGTPWTRHVIDDSSRGADGVRLADVNDDGMLDIATGWEEGGITRVYLNPGPAEAHEKWPAVTVGRTPSVEDAVFVDLDDDGAVDVVSCCEGSTRTMFVSWAPVDRRDCLNPEAWRQETLPPSAGIMQWMFCIPMQVDGKNGVDLVAGGKGDTARIGWFESPHDPRALAEYTWHPISDAGWVMSLILSDMDGDGAQDIVTSDRRGRLRGCRWLENPGPGPEQRTRWRNHFIGGRENEVMFMTIADLDGDGSKDALAAARDETGQNVLCFHRPAGPRETWTVQVIPFPEGTGTAKSVAVGDIDANGRPDIVVSCESAETPRSGVVWMSRTVSGWQPHEISGKTGIKFDRLELLDLDGDGDLDVLTCEEKAKDTEGKRKGLGVFWYENPYR